MKHVHGSWICNEPSDWMGGVMGFYYIFQMEFRFYLLFPELGFQGSSKHSFECPLEMKYDVIIKIYIWWRKHPKPLEGL